MVNRMTVAELIEELEQYPMTLPVVTNSKEITDIQFNDNMYFLDNSPQGYTCYPAVELE